MKKIKTHIKAFVLAAILQVVIGYIYYILKWDMGDAAFYIVLYLWIMKDLE